MCLFIPEVAEISPSLLVWCVSPHRTYGVHRSPDQLQNNESSPPSPLSSRVPLVGKPDRGRSSSLGGTRFQSPPGLGDLGGKNLGDETQETYVYTVASPNGAYKGVNSIHATAPQLREATNFHHQM